MSDPAANSVSLTPEQLQRAILARLQFEQAMGIETVRRRELEPARTATTRDSGEQGQARTPPAPPFQGGESGERVSTSMATTSVAAAGASASDSAAAPQDVAARWQDLETRALACTLCPLHKTRTNVVFGVGNRSAKLVFVGEAPGEDEDQQGEPFVGRAGQLLNKIITAMKWTREEVYICNTIKCRPPQNRTPLPDEILACNPLLVEQIELIGPKIIVALGSPAAKTLLQTNQGIMSLRGRWGAYRGIPVMPTFHPAYLLRSYTEENRRSVWEDMKKVADKLKE